jgi:hypothetical protein
MHAWVRETASCKTVWPDRTGGRMGVEITNTKHQRKRQTEYSCILVASEISYERWRTSFWQQLGCVLHCQPSAWRAQVYLHGTPVLNTLFHLACLRASLTYFIQGGSNMTGTNCDLFTHNQSRSYLNHIVYSQCFYVRSVFVSAVWFRF